MLRHLLGQQVTLCDLNLFLVRIAAQLDDFHPIQQRPGNGVRGVGGGDEHNLGEIHRDLQEMVPEGAVLLAVQHLQQCRGRIAPVIAAQLVDLIQQHQRIHGAAAADGLNDAAGHSADVRFPVSPDICLIPDAAQGEPGQLTVERLGNRDGNGGLAYARRTHQAEDLPLAIRIHLPDGNGLQNPLFYLFQAEMVLFQHLSGSIYADSLPGGLIPGHLQAHVQIIADHGALRAAERLLGKLCHLFQKVLFRLLFQVQRLDAVPVVLQLIVDLVALAQFILQHADLGAEDLLPLGAHQLLPDLALHLTLKAQDVIFPGQERVHLPQADKRRELFQDLLLIRIAQGDVLGDVVGQIAGVPAVHDRGHHFLRQAARLLGVVGEQVICLAQQRLRPGTGQERLGDRRLLQKLHIGL